MDGVAPSGTLAERSCRCEESATRQPRLRLLRLRLAMTINAARRQDPHRIEFHTDHDSSFHAISQNIHSYRELMMNACSMRAFSPSLAFFDHASHRPRSHRPTSATSGEA